MTQEEQKCIQHLQKGIEYKRIGDLNNAISEYNNAFNVYPYNINIYGNLAKIFMSIGQPEYAMRNILIYSHFTLLNGNINMESFEFSLDFYNWSGKVNDKNLSSDLPLKAVTNNLNLAKIISDINLTFWAGFTYVIKHKNSGGFDDIPAKYLNNYINSLLGKPILDYYHLGEEKESKIRLIGLAYILSNLVSKSDLTKDDIIDIYLDERNFRIDDI